MLLRLILFHILDWTDCEQTPLLIHVWRTLELSVCLNLGHLPLKMESKFLEAAAYTIQNMANSEGGHNTSTCQLQDRGWKRKLHFSKCTQVSTRHDTN